MKFLSTFESYSINETKFSHTMVSRADEIFNLVDKALEGNQFYRIQLNDRVFLKEGNKRLTRAESFSKYIWVTVNNYFFEDKGNEIAFEYKYKQFTVDKRRIQEKTREEYLKYWLDRIHKRMMNNQDQDSHWRDEASAAGSSGSGLGANSQVNPFMDAGFMVHFAEKYDIDLQQYYNDSSWTTGYNTIMQQAEQYPF